MEALLEISEPKPSLSEPLLSLSKQETMLTRTSLSLAELPHLPAVDQEPAGAPRGVLSKSALARRELVRVQGDLTIEEN